MPRSSPPSVPTPARTALRGAPRRYMGGSVLFGLLSPALAPAQQLVGFSLLSTLALAATASGYAAGGARADGSYTHGDPTDGDCSRPPYCVAQASSTAWQQYRMQACAAPAVQDSAAYNKSCCRVSISNAQRRNDVERMLMQAMGVAWCAAAAERHEARHAPARFGLVVFARPDLVWWQPFKPWCSWPSHVVLSCEAPGCDAAG